MSNKIMIVRHGEKPTKGVAGVAPDGRRSKQDLTTRGWQRAGALVRLFHPLNPAGFRPGLATPHAIFASRVEPGERSRRPRHTVEPLARELGLEVHHKFGNDRERTLVRKVRAVPGPVLICWHHENIPRLIDMIAPPVRRPRSWPSERFDLVWILDREDEARPWRLVQIPQLILCGDSADIVPI